MTEQLICAKQSEGQWEGHYDVDDLKGWQLKIKLYH